MKLLWVFAEWHGLAKLRMHNDHTLALLDTLTTDLGEGLRRFVQTTCHDVITKELSREYQARKRRQAKQKGKQAATGKGLRQRKHPKAQEGAPGSTVVGAGEYPALSTLLLAAVFTTSPC